MTPAVCVVVPTFRRPQLLARCLDALERQQHDLACIEVVVVDDGHDDATREEVEGRSRGLGAAELDRHRLRYLRPQGRGPAAARNAGWLAAAAPLVAFTDDDTVPDARWLAEGHAAMARRPDWVAMAGRVVVPVDDRDAPSDHARMTQGLESAEFVTANAFVRRDALERIHGFDERFKRAWREDSDLQFRLLALGPVGRCAEAQVVHPVREAGFGICIGQQRNAFYEALLYAKHRTLYRERIERTPPWRYYGIVAASAGAMFCAGAREAAGAKALGCVAIALVGWVAWQRIAPTTKTWRHMVEMAVTSAVIPFLAIYWRLRGAWHFRVPFI